MDKCPDYSYLNSIAIDRLFGYSGATPLASFCHTVFILQTLPQRLNQGPPSKASRALQNSFSSKRYKAHPQLSKALVCP